MLPKFHAAFGAAALLIIATFWAATVTTIVIGDKYLIVMAKTGIAWGLWALIPMLILTGLSGNRLGQNLRGPLIGAKQKRMKIIAFNGIIFLVPSALILLPLAMQGQGGLPYWGIQTVEPLAGAATITLLSFNMRDGLRLSRRRAGSA
ncbi:MULTISPECIES: hypothetical protein [Roseobacteraceae]|uniref:hypothetical protein n=1 Tax=Roseobacteraceae TaxID=2854170 RepID=UPI00125EFCE6|nr:MULTISPECIES: hypothetical protein [Roseobacteraceae]KAB6717889.1 hypothetical protein C8029_01730 [Roseobacter sp. TSBP12]|tara:strand:- start:6906 stop:7349 length:444 start_codon:yes stop_codon:yes gene_type:complete